MRSLVCVSGGSPELAEQDLIPRPASRGGGMDMRNTLVQVLPTWRRCRVRRRFAPATYGRAAAAGLQCAGRKERRHEQQVDRPAGAERRTRRLCHCARPGRAEAAVERRHLEQRARLRRPEQRDGHELTGRRSVAQNRAMDSPDYSAGAAWQRGGFVPIAQASVPLTDWGFLRSDAAYDVVTVWDGAFFRLDAHLERFLRSCARFRLDPGRSPDAIVAILTECVRLAGL